MDTKKYRLLVEAFTYRSLVVPGEKEPRLTAGRMTYQLIIFDTKEEADFAALTLLNTSIGGLYVRNTHKLYQ